MNSHFIPAGRQTVQIQNQSRRQRAESRERNVCVVHRSASWNSDILLESDGQVEKSTSRLMSTDFRIDDQQFGRRA
jgi:hypothetical protein